ncbi:MAG: glycosyltransferase family 4 protein [Sideroxydans sp.]|nr:glycosyltransferase family 4 protein [Sideroxydans sp.]
MKIGIAGPISTESIARFIDGDVSTLPVGYGGAPLLGTLIGELLARGHEVSAYTTSPNLPLNLAEPAMAQGERFKIYYCPVRKHSVRMNGWHLGRIVDFFRLERRFIEQAIRMDNPDIVHAHWAYEFALAAIASGKPHVVTCHDAPQEILKYMPNIYRLGRYFMARKAMRTAQQLTTVSPYMREALMTLVSKEIEVIPNPIPPQIAHRPLNISHPLTKSAPVIVMVANGWDNQKNPQAGLLAFAKLRAANSGAKLRMFGSGYGQGEQASLWAAAQGIADGVEFVGRLPYAKLLEEMANADVFLHPALEESFGMVVAEALALGVPAIGGKLSGAVPWVIGEGGVLVDVTNVDDIANALIAILSDPENWQRLRAAAYQAVQSRFTPNVVVDAYEKLYRHLIEGKVS